MFNGCGIAGFLEKTAIVGKTVKFLSEFSDEKWKIRCFLLFPSFFAH